MPQTRSRIAFDRVTLDFSVRGASRIEWHMRPDFFDPLPWVFQLQVNPNAGEPDQWENVGGPVLNQFYALDTEQRIFGQQLTQAYRVQLETAAGEYVSGMAQPLGNLRRKDWLHVLAIYRRLRLQSNKDALEGYLLKRRIYADTCPLCVNPYTETITQSNCDLCKGTGKVLGYWPAVDVHMIDYLPTPTYTRQGEGEAADRQTIDETLTQGVYLGVPQLATRDVWVMKGSGKRYFVEKISTVGTMGDTPVIVQVALRLAELTDIIYDVPLTLDA